MPSIAELRAETQPDWLLARPNAEHWAGRLYMRRLSPFVTRLVLRTPLSANAVTAAMIPAGLLAGLALTVTSIWGAIAAALLIQFQLLLDCVDGEVARWRKTFSPLGIYLDQLGHYTAEAAIPAGLGVRADGGFHSVGGWTALGLLTSLLVLFLKAETHLIPYALRKGGRAEPAEEEAPATAPRLLPSIRPHHAIEASLLALVAAILDSATGDLTWTRALSVALAVYLGVSVVGHLAAILLSRRLK